MLDSGVGSASPLPIVVGRVLSAYTVGAVQNHQETITYTVYNEQADPETGVLLTTTLEPGVTLRSATQEPDQSGQNLAWSLGTIGGYGRASVTLTVNLTSPVPLQLDSGAQAYRHAGRGRCLKHHARRDASARKRRPQPARLDPRRQHHRPVHPGRGGQARLRSAQIFDFLHTQIGYNSYVGSVRGARGTLWSSAGNALDVASLGVALMRASGIPAQYAQGTLSQTHAQQLILSMFPPSDQTVGTFRPARRRRTRRMIRNCFPRQNRTTGSSLTRAAACRDADPLMPGAAIGQVVHDRDRHVRRSARQPAREDRRSSSEPRSTARSAPRSVVGSRDHDRPGPDVQ